MLREFFLTCYYLAPFFFKCLIIPGVLFWIVETVAAHG